MRLILTVALSFCTVVGQLQAANSAK